MRKIDPVSAIADFWMGVFGLLFIAALIGSVLYTIYCMIAAAFLYPIATFVILAILAVILSPALFAIAWNKFLDWKNREKN